MKKLFLLTFGLVWIAPVVLKAQVQNAVPVPEIVYPNLFSGPAKSSKVIVGMRADQFDEIESDQDVPMLFRVYVPQQGYGASEEMGAKISLTISFSLDDLHLFFPDSGKLGEEHDQFWALRPWAIKDIKENIVFKKPRSRIYMAKFPKDNTLSFEIDAHAALQNHIIIYELTPPSFADRGRSLKFGVQVIKASELQIEWDTDREK